MSIASPLHRWRGPPLVLQILGLLLTGLVVAQVVTLLLTLILPPAPSPQHSIAEVAAALQGVPSGEARPDALDRVVQSGPPDLTGAGWLISNRSERELAQRLGVDPADVRLAFYTPLPFAGTSSSRMKVGFKANDGPIPGFGPGDASQKVSLLLLAQAAAPPPPMTRFPEGRALPSRELFQQDRIQRDGPGRGTRTDHGPSPFGGGIDPSGAVRADPLIRIDPTPLQRGQGGIWIGGDHGETVPEILRNPPVQTPGTSAPATGISPDPSRLPPLAEFRRDLGQRSFDRGQLLGPILPDRSLIVPGPRTALSSELAPIETPLPSPPVARIEQPPPARGAAPTANPVVEPPQSTASLPVPTVALPDIRAPNVASPSADPMVPLVGRAGGLFGFAPSPFVEGDFVAALRLANGRWAVVQPAPEPFPNAWQRRVLLWFAIAFAVVAPLGWLFARRIVKPLVGFALAAERLGRDPSAATLELDGPAEVGRAARALNIMQSRLKSFVDDRTAMIGAISHDLRTPLTRMRFRIEDVDDEAVRDGMIEEVEQMEQMITSVLAFIRNASAQGVRERADLRSILEDVVEDAAMVGGDVTFAHGGPAPVEVDVLSMRRLFANLVENAVKYGDRARVSLTVDLDEAVAEVRDDGPGVPEEDLERAFEPFYRAPDAIISNKRGSGLGLTVCRSIARAHGGDVRLSRTDEGFVAQLRVPLSFAGQARAA